MKRGKNMNENEYPFAGEQLSQQDIADFLQQTMKERYIKTAAHAAHCERTGNYSMAAELWMNALQVATGINRDWCESRLAICQLNDLRLCETQISSE